MRIAVIVCSVGRPDSLAVTLPWLSRQTKVPSRILCVVAQPSDVPDLDALDCGPVKPEVVISPKGLPRQRNRGLDLVQDECDAVFFIDDDYLPAANALEGIERAFAAFPEASGVTGHLLADGITTGGLTFDEARRIVSEFDARAGGRSPEPRAMKRNLFSLYGCNMAIRCDRIGATRFDERLPLYAWQEDVDFAARLEGEKIRTDALTGVHCGVTSGRETSGHLLGYSQVANNMYLMRKGSLPPVFALQLMARNVLKNHVKMFSPEPWIDRRSRARGNRLALRDLMRGRARPERILELT